MVSPCLMADMSEFRPMSYYGTGKASFQLLTPPGANRHDVTSWRSGPHQCDIVAVEQDSVR